MDSASAAGGRGYSKEVVMCEQVLIYRHTEPMRYERWVTVFLPQGMRYQVDPAHEVGLATGTNLSREGCILSMADGFIGAGYQVQLQYKHGPSRLYTKTYPSKLCYYLFGLVWIRGEWPRLRNSLTCIVPSHRLSVLEHTSQYYFDLGYVPGRVRLMVP
jgi:hypothetical protein